MIRYQLGADQTEENGNIWTENDINAHGEKRGAVRQTDL